jgi:2-hydroxychromene-2-carboxylate isomerase
MPSGAEGPGRDGYAPGMLTLHFDYPSPASAVALLRLQRLADVGHTVRFVGLDSLGLDVPVPPTLDQLDELARYRERAIALGLPMRRPSWRPPTLSAHLVGTLADEVGLGASWRWTCLRGYWAEGIDLSDPDALMALGEEAGLARTAVENRLADRVARHTLRGRMTTRRRAGIGGVPVLEADAGVYVSPDLPDAELEELAAL